MRHGNCISLASKYKCFGSTDERVANPWTRVFLHSAVAVAGDLPLINFVGAKSFLRRGSRADHSTSSDTCIRGQVSHSG